MDLIEQLKRDEGVRAFPYIDTVGKTTIGAGRNLTDVGISSEEIDVLLANDIQRAEASLASNLPWFATLDIVRQGALINLCFNMGWTRLSKFHNTLAAFERKDWAGAAEEMEASEWARQVGDRATRLAEQVRTGEWV